jgi:hypothetical protein
MDRSLIKRIERLEARRPQVVVQTHRLVQEVGETQVTARARYERESGRAIGPDDFVILRAIVDPSKEMTA